MAEKQCNLIKNGGGMSEYSTSEVFTGEYWIDGNPIYRQVVEGTSPSTTGTWSGLGSLPRGLNIIKMEGFIHISTVARIPINFYQSSSVYVGTYYGQSATEGYFNMIIGPSSYADKPVKIIVEYTKT